MSRFDSSAAPGARLLLAVGLAALVGTAIAPHGPARADNAAVEPEVGAAAAMPGMPPAPAGAARQPSARQPAAAPAPTAAVSSPVSKPPSQPANAPMRRAGKPEPAAQEAARTGRTPARETAASRDTAAAAQAKAAKRAAAKAETAAKEAKARTEIAAAKELAAAKAAKAAKEAAAKQMTAAEEAAAIRDAPSRREAMAAMEGPRRVPVNPPAPDRNLEERAEPAPPMAAELHGPSDLTVVTWSIGGGNAQESGGPPIAAQPGQPISLQLTVQGGEAAVDQLLAAGSIPIVVHWRRDAADADTADELTSRLTIGHRGVGSGLAGEVEHTGHFNWHTWTRARPLGSGQWTISVTYPDGRPLACGSGPEEHPCRFSINIG